jgi:hypothetical protein
LQKRANETPGIFFFFLAFDFDPKAMFGTVITFIFLMSRQNKLENKEEGK